MIVDQAAVETMDVGGSQLQFLVTPEQAGREGYSVLRGTLPAGGIVPLHSHPDIEIFYVLSGQMEVYEAADAPEGSWRGVGSGQTAAIRGSVKHAWRNTAASECVCVVFTGSDVCHFLQEVAQPFDPAAAPKAPDPEMAARMMELSKRYGHWLASPQENEAIGLHLGK